MDPTNLIAVTVILVLVLQPTTASVDDILSPILSPIFDDLCKNVECGRGTCKPSNSSFSFECDCQPGWKQTRSDDDNHLKFLPCIVPNCSLNYSCTNVSSPVSVKETPDNTSIFDPCHWTYCGGGSCTKKSPFTYDCKCAEGFYNLLNVTAFPCYKECAIGMDCANLGISTSNASSSTPVTVGNAGMILRGNYNWLIILMMSQTTFLWI